MEPTFRLHFVPPPDELADYVESIGMLRNDGTEDKEVVVLPDGRIDLFLWRTEGYPFQLMLMGLETASEQRYIPPKTLAFVISFRPLAVEYVLKETIAGLLDTAKELSLNFWELKEEDLNDFEAFYINICKKVTANLSGEIDERKRRLFQLIHSSKGEMSVGELAQAVHWNSRQINRYFSQWLGLPLKAYCSILRFRASLAHIAHGKLFPELNFSDQNHFIKQIKKFSGVVPRELTKNKNDRFVLLSVLKRG